MPEPPVLANYPRQHSIPVEQRCAHATSASTRSVSVSAPMMPCWQRVSFIPSKHQLRSQPAVQTDNVMNLPSLVSALLEAAETASCLRTRARTGESLLWALGPMGLCTAGARSRSGAVILTLRRGGRTAMSNASVLRGGSALGFHARAWEPIRIRNTRWAGNLVRR